MIISPIAPKANAYDGRPADRPVDPGFHADADEMVRASRAKIDRSLETLRRVARLLAKLSKK